jgi:hypothetical protein
MRVCIEYVHGGMPHHKVVRCNCVLVKGSSNCCATRLSDVIVFWCKLVAIAVRRFSVQWQIGIAVDYIFDKYLYNLTVS